MSKVAPFVEDLFTPSRVISEIYVHPDTMEHFLLTTIKTRTDFIDPVTGDGFYEVESYRRTLEIKDGFVLQLPFDTKPDISGLIFIGEL